MITYIQTWAYFNGTQIASYPLGTNGVYGATNWQSYTPTLQTYGPGTYTIYDYHAVYTPYCGGIWEPPYSNGWNGWGPYTYISISRPGRPDYAPGVGHPVFYLGPGIPYSGQYSASTSLIAGNPNGAPETPQWVFQAGGTFGSLNCTTCQEPGFTAQRRSTGCLSYDVVLVNSYNGFLSDPFYMFINGPNNTVAANDPIGGIWNWTTAWGNGWQSRINYTTSTLCSFDAPMSNYDMNESFGAWSPSSWARPTPNGFSVSGSQWLDTMAFQCPGNNCTPMPQNPPAGCWPLCGSVKVQSAPQYWKVGTQSVGFGYEIQQDTHQRYQDHGSHDAIVTPVSQ